MQKSRISTDRNVAFKRIDTDTQGQMLPTKQLKTPGFEVTVWCFGSTSHSASEFLQPLSCQTAKLDGLHASLSTTAAIV